MSKRKNEFKKNRSQRALWFVVALVILGITGMLGTFIELFVGLVVGAVGLFVGLTVGLIGLVIGVIGGIIGLVIGLLPIALFIGMIFIVMKVFRGSGNKRKNDSDVTYL